MRKGHISPLSDQYIAHPFIITTINSMQHGRHDELVSITGEAELDSSCHQSCQNFIFDLQWFYGRYSFTYKKGKTESFFKNYLSIVYLKVAKSYIYWLCKKITRKRSQFAKHLNTRDC